MPYEAKPVYLMNPTNPIREIHVAEESFNKKWLALHSYSDEKIFYHYTNLEGLTGIIKTRSFWFSHNCALNDPKENEYSQKIINSILENTLNKLSDDEDKSSFFKYIKDNLSFFRSQFYDTYLSCFCEKENLLSQWRGYSNYGMGLNIGILINNSTKYIHSLNDIKDETYIVLRRVIYREDEQQSLITEYFDELINALNYAKNNNPDYNEKSWIAQAALQAANILFDVVNTFKNPAFEEENEWRLIKVKSTNTKPELVNYRSTESSIVPYLTTYLYELKNDKEVFPIKSIMIGPSASHSISPSIIKILIYKESVNGSQINLCPEEISIKNAGFVLR